ncbi:sensor histidine kinase [Confluentibacter citreus]|uniref:sensor histidine kinase n=1 Tax=Confluentibacter citreus TaxID=2007307 RepID=UPI000C28AACF|nr:HAMP domain-containing sensor histidine kinase [Confluentibacter citreus]
MNSTETALKERIKELTCLYKVSSIISMAHAESIDNTLKAIASCLKEAFQFPEQMEVIIDTQDAISQVLDKTEAVSIHSDILVFNKKNGCIYVTYKEDVNTPFVFLKEEQLLINNVALKIGDLLERIEIRNNEIALKRQMEKADRLAILGELTAGIAHELNTPLANILGFSELLKSKLKTDEASVADLDKIINSAIYSREVVKKLMFFACEMPQEMKRVNIVPIIKNAMNLLELTFRKNQVKYIATIDDDVIMLRADSVQLTQIIFNLLINAIYFSPENGLVTISASQNKKAVIIKISDEGTGLSDEALEKVFQPFYSTKPVGEGSGLGLSVVHGIVMSHKGTILVKNNPLKGSTFTVTLPK